MAKILVVDDNEDVREAIEDYLELDSHETVSVESGEAALVEFVKAEFDLIITDVLMSGMTGIELTEKILEQKPAQKILVCSGGDIGGPEMAYLALEQASKEGAVSTIMKPFKRTDFIEKINNLIAGS